ncbi:MAG: PD-(D/E)XK nuclease family protein [Bacillati bacterium]
MVTELSPNDALSARLTQAILYGKSPTSEIDSGSSRSHIYMSEVSNCIRQTYYKITGEPVDIDSDNDNGYSFIMQYGNMFEDLISERFAQIGIPRAKLRLGSGKFNISGETDPVIKFEDKYIITECKATHRDNFNKIIMRLTQYNQYPENYYDQLQMYLWLAPKADLGMLIIANRDMRPNDKTPPFIVVPVERSVEWKTKNFQRLNDLNNAIEKGIAPDREYTPKDMQCKYCPFFKPCYEGVDFGATEFDSRNY